MSEQGTTRPFQERFLDGYNRAQLRREVQNMKPRRNYAAMALGVSLALGALIPLKVYRSIEVAAKRRAPPVATERLVPQLATDLRVIERHADRGTADFFLEQVPFGSIIFNEAKKNNLSPVLLAAIAHAESSFHPGARSQRGAIGIMQLIPRTGRWLGATDLTDPTQNIIAGAKYLAYLSDRFGGNEEQVIAAYNAGEGNVRRYDGVPPFQETRDYVDRVRRFQRDLHARINGQVSDLSIGWVAPASYRARLRPKIDIHWTTPQERRAQKQRS